jgi:hypothetical protein
MGGCLKNVFAMFGCLVIFVAVAIISFVYQEPIIDAYHAFAGDLPEATGVELTGPGRPDAEWDRSARRKQEAMARFLGPESVTLNPGEAASLVQAGLDPIAEAALDSIQVTLEAGRFVVDAQLLTAVWGQTELGMFAGVLRPQEPLRVGGAAEVIGPGIISWAPDELRIRDIPLPTPMIRFLLNSMTGRDDGVVLLAAPVTIRDMEIREDEITFFRRVR